MPKSKRTSTRVPKPGNTMWIGMIIFSSVWMFVLGIFVGRGTAPVRFDIEAIQKELVALKETVLRKEKERRKSRMEATNRKTDLGFYEALKAPTATTEMLDTGPGKGLTETLVLEKMSVSPAGTTNNETAPYAVQVASVKDIRAAEELVARLGKQTYSAYRTVGEVPGKGVWHRVRIGHFGSKSEAARMIQRLERDGYEPYLVKQR